MSNEEINFIKKYDKAANTFALCVGFFLILTFGFLFVISIPGIIYNLWNNLHHLKFVKIVIITFASLSSIIGIIILITIIKTQRAIKKLKNIVSQNEKVQEEFRNQNYARSAIILNQVLALTFNDRKYGAENAAIDSISMIALALSMRKVADELNSYLPEEQRPKKIKFKYIFIVTAILSLTPVVFGINASLKDRKEIIETREEVVAKLKSVYQDYNPYIDDRYHRNGYYEDNVKIILGDESVIDVTMLKHGQGKITEIEFISKEYIENENNSESTINNLLEKVEMLYQRTNQYKYYYKEIFRDQVPAYQMDEEHRNELIQKLDNLLYKDGSTREYQKQYYQNRDSEPKTAVDQDIYLEKSIDENINRNFVILNLTIREHKLSR